MLVYTTGSNPPTVISTFSISSRSSWGAPADGKEKKRWDGRSPIYKVIESVHLSGCLYTSTYTFKRYTHTASTIYQQQPASKHEPAFYLCSDIDVCPCKSFPRAVVSFSSSWIISRCVYANR